MFQSLPTPLVMHSLGMWKAWTRLTLAVGQAAFGFPSAPKGNPSPRPIMPSRLSNEWFSIMTTTMCSISGSCSVPAARDGLGSDPGWRIAGEREAASHPRLFRVSG